MVAGGPPPTEALDHLLRATAPPRRRRGRLPGLPPGLRRGASGRAALWLAACAVVAVTVGWFAWRWVARPAPLEERIPRAQPSVTASTASTAGEGGAGEGGTGDLTVHVAGAVRNPGVVHLPGGSRVVDAVAAAGGLVPEGDADRLNLAAPLLDGSRVAVPRVGEPPPAEIPPATGTPGAAQPGAAGPATPVDLNTATAEQLDTLPGVGPATAAAIVAQRERVGRFASVEDLLDVRGIGPARLDAVRDLVSVG